MNNIDIGLLWQEPTVSGEVRGRYAAEWCTEPDGWINLDDVTGEFSATAQYEEHSVDYGVRLAEMLSPQAVDSILRALEGLSFVTDLEVVEAGRKWEVGDRSFDNRVWWPVMKLGSLDHAEAVLAELRRLPGLNPLGLTIVRLNKAAASRTFAFTAGEKSTDVVEIRLRPLDEESTFVINNVPVGRGFHWERRESLEYRGELRLFQPEGSGLTVVNRLPLESYLESTVGSEMRSDLPPAFSQAQAIAARSTVLATANRHHFADGFDLCNDDHCQCYQGVAREAEAVIEPVRETAGQLLVWQDRVVDARYSKCCGGVSEYYESTWGPEGPDYFDARTCGDFPLPDLTERHAARAFLESDPPCWCNAERHPYPQPWDKETLFRWEVSYTPAELGALVHSKTGTEVGSVRNLRVRRRGRSGRILILTVEGSISTLKLYGELTIRNALSDTHLPSSFFVSDFVEGRIVLKGGGWGHGVGLCQLGAVAMANAGHTVEQILAHYYPGSSLSTL